MNLLYRIRSAAARFMYGRNGVDPLCVAMLTLALALNIAAGFLRVPGLYIALSLLSAILLALMLYRVLSRNLAKRREENARFVYGVNSVRGGFRDRRLRRADKAHRYVRCECGVWCRVPRHVGKVELMCPKCGAKKIVKT